MAADGVTHQGPVMGTGRTGMSVGGVDAAVLTLVPFGITERPNRRSPRRLLDRLGLRSADRDAVTLHTGIERAP